MEMKIYIVAPLVVAALSILWIWAFNRRPRITGALWPRGMTLGGSVARPDLDYDGDLALACEGSFGVIRCRTLRIAAGADVAATRIEAAQVTVDGRLHGVDVLAAGKRVDIRGELRADSVEAPWIRIGRKSKAMVLTVSGTARIDRHPGAQVKGFFTEADELESATEVRRSRRTRDGSEYETVLQ